MVIFQALITIIIIITNFLERMKRSKIIWFYSSKKKTPCDFTRSFIKHNVDFIQLLAHQFLFHLPQVWL